MKSIQEKIEEIRTNGYSINFENIFEPALENYKKIAVYAGLMLIVFLSLFFGILFALVYTYYDFDTLIKNISLLSENPQALSSEFLLGYFATTILMSCLLSPFQAGFLKMADCGQKGEEFQVSTIFEYYKLPYFTSIVLTTLIVALSGTGISILLESNGIKLIGTLLSCIISFLTFLSIPLIVFGKMNAINSIKASALIMSKKPLVLLGLIIVSLLFSLVGFIGCIIGIFFTIPFMYSMNYTIYATIVGIESNDVNENTESMN